MQVFVQDTSRSTTIPIAIPATSSVAQLKALVHSAKRNIHPEHQRLSFGNRVLDDERCLSDYNISNESTILLRYGPKFPFTWRAPPESLAQDFELPSHSSKGYANVCTILGGSRTKNAKPFSPIRSYVPNVQVPAFPAAVYCVTFLPHNNSAVDVLDGQQSSRLPGTSQWF